MSKSYEPLIIREGRVTVALLRYPYLSRHTWLFSCHVCGAEGHHQPLQSMAGDDAYEHINAEHARMAHPES